MAKTKLCPVCGKFQKNGWTVENLANEPGRESFPDEFDKLIPIEPKADDPKKISILQCPNCGLVYEYRTFTPGGSYDAMLNWIVESLTPLMKKGKHLRKNIPPKPPAFEKIREFICPICQSEDIDCLNAGIIGGETFITLKCTKCGIEDTLDEYQLMSWRPRTET